MENVAHFIDHTALKPDCDKTTILKLCKEARDYGFYSVCVNLRWLPTAVSELRGSKVLPIVVVGFPLGACGTPTKVFETEEAIEAGAKEIDMVIDLGSLKSRDDKSVETDIVKVVRAAKQAPVKVILETCLLNNSEIVRACEIAVRAGAKFVKTSTGFGSAGATAEHIRLMRETVGPSIGVKASGGVRTFATLKEMVEAGATRVGSSNSVSIVEEEKALRK